MSAAGFQKQELALMNNSFIVPKYISAPYTTIQNRAQVLDASNMLQAVMGVERVPFRGINLLQKEFGPNGEQVYELESKDARIRAIGSWLSISDTSGSRIKTATIGDVVEIAFYGTGLNALLTYSLNTTTSTVTIDNGSAASWALNASASAVLNARNYITNQIVNLASGLVLGWHRVLITNAGTLDITGIEVLNVNSSLTITPGQAFIGNKKDSLAVLSTSAYNAGFVGTKGGRVAKYLLNRVPSQVVMECAASPSYLTSTDHTNEDVVKKVNVKDFGVNRSDDFSTTSAGKAAAFTLDDGVTTLVADLIINNNALDGIANSSVNFFTLTFIGTGLDVICADTATGSIDSTSISVDGGTIQLLYGPTSTVASIKTLKICSGLPYGTHTVKFNRSASGTVRTFFSDFIIYQPKAPTLPVGAIQIADYNVMANYIANTTVVMEAIGSGLLRKQISQREAVFVGTWAESLLPTQYTGGWQAYTTGAADYVEYKFFGTGFELRCQAATNSATAATVTVDGVIPTGVTTAVYGMNSYTAGTGVLNMAAGANISGAGFSLYGLSLGEHTVRITKGSGGTYLYVETFDYITPIHINHPALKIGSLGLLDNAKIQALALPVSGPDLGKCKAWVQFDGVNNKITASYNISQVLKMSTGFYLVYFIKPFKTANYSAIAIGSWYQTAVHSTAQNSAIIYSWDYSTSPVDATMNVAFFGELLDE